MKERDYTNAVFQAQVNWLPKILKRTDHGWQLIGRS
jgi:lipid-A-disaccharide synthase-like uncharacterized protein